MPQVIGVYEDREEAYGVAARLIRNLFLEFAEDQDADGYTLEECIIAGMTYFKDYGDVYYVAVKRTDTAQKMTKQEEKPAGETFFL